MTIRLKPEQERVIGRALQAGVIRTVDNVVDLGLETIQRRLEGQGAPAASMSAEQWLQEYHSWVHSHPTTTPLLSDEAISREVIYDTRGR